MAWGEKRFVGSFFESFVAELLYFGVPIAAIVVGIAGGIYVHGRTNSKFAGWTLGLLLMLGIGGLRIFAEDIPGVGWRIQKMDEARDLARELD